MGSVWNSWVGWVLVELLDGSMLLQVLTLQFITFNKNSRNVRLFGLLVLILMSRPSLLEQKQNRSHDPGPSEPGLDEAVNSKDLTLSGSVSFLLNTSRDQNHGPAPVSEPLRVTDSGSEHSGYHGNRDHDMQK